MEAEFSGLNNELVIIMLSIQGFTVYHSNVICLSIS